MASGDLTVTEPSSKNEIILFDFELYVLDPQLDLLNQMNWSSTRQNKVVDSNVGELSN
jgi:hypothetical protein